MKNFSVSIVGMGYVGLCTAVGFASKENSIIAVDNDPEKMDSL
jgi:UDP-glucose 6-dehydrogenase